mgnify:CR=1 FL=1
MSELKCAVVGLGRIGSTLEADPLREKPCTHAGAIFANADCTLVAGCDLRAEAREEFKSQWSQNAPVELYENIDALLQAVRPDILSIATPPDSHRRLVAKAARAGVPVAICEKPLAHTLRDAKAIARIHTTGKMKIVVNHERRYSRDYQLVREAIRTRRFGSLLSLRGTLYFGRSASHKAVLLHDGTHMIDIINYLTDSVCSVKKSYGAMRASSSSAFLFGRAGSVPVCLEVGSQRDHLVFELELSFEQGRIRIGNGVLSFEESGPSPYYSDYRSLLPADTPVVASTGYFAGMLADAVRCCREAEYQPISNAAASLEVMRFIRSV